MEKESESTSSEIDDIEEDFHLKFFDKP